MITTTQSIHEANLITHGGVFHADDVFATVIMAKVLGDVKVFRTFKVPHECEDTNVVVYDIGNGRFDHHQRGGNGARANGVPYASAGLLWKEFGYELLREFSFADAEHIWRYMDYFLISGIDAVDNGDLPKREYPIQDMNVSRVISQFNPDWDSTETPDEAFLRAVAFAEVIFDTTFARAVSEVKARAVVEKAIKSSKNQIMVLDRFVPWQNWVLTSTNEKAANILFVVFPSNRGGYNWQCIPVGNGDRSPRKSVPTEWCGLTGAKLQAVCGVATATFCHAAGFIGSADTLDDAIMMARKASEV